MCICLLRVYFYSVSLVFLSVWLDLAYCFPFLYVFNSVLCSFPVFVWMYFTLPSPHAWSPLGLMQVTLFTFTFMNTTFHRHFAFLNVASYCLENEILHQSPPSSYIIIFSFVPLLMFRSWFSVGVIGDCRNPLYGCCILKQLLKMNRYIKMSLGTTDGRNKVALRGVCCAASYVQ